MDDERRLAVMLAEIASDSLRKRESKGRYKERLEALREILDEHIEAALA